jgi:hypothetical protein
MKHGRSSERLEVDCYDDIEPAGFARFIELTPFRKGWEKLGLNDEDRRALEILIMTDPNRRTVPGTGGLVKIRFSSSRWNVGKRGGARVCYAYFAEFSTVLLVTIYKKGEKSDLSEKEKREIKVLLSEFDEMLKKGQIDV